MRKIEHKEEITINNMIDDGALLAIALTEEGILITQPNLFLILSKTNKGRDNSRFVISKITIEYTEFQPI